MFRVCVFAALLATAPTLPAQAGDPYKVAERFSGDWLGTGQLLIGPRSGLKFHCELSGDPRASKIMSFKMKGRCWMGALSAPVYAELRYNSETDRFYGEFMDGAEGDGVDIVGAEAPKGISMRLSRGSVQGNLTAETVNDNQMRAVLSLIDSTSKREFPVVAMGFARKEAAAMGLPPYLPDVATGSIGGR